MGPARAFDRNFVLTAARLDEFINSIFGARQPNSPSVPHLFLAAASARLEFLRNSRIPKIKY